MRGPTPALQGLGAFFPFPGKPQGNWHPSPPLSRSVLRSAILDTPRLGRGTGSAPWARATRRKSFSCLQAPARARGLETLAWAWERWWVGCRVGLCLAVIGGSWLLPPQECADGSEVCIPQPSRAAHDSRVLRLRAKNEWASGPMATLCPRPLMALGEEEDSGDHREGAWASKSAHHAGLCDLGPWSVPL